MEDVDFFLEHGYLSEEEMDNSGISKFDATGGTHVMRGPFTIEEQLTLHMITPWSDDKTTSTLGWH